VGNFHWLEMLSDGEGRIKTLTIARRVIYGLIIYKHQKADKSRTENNEGESYVREKLSFA
jgi:hypothetical protein